MGARTIWSAAFGSLVLVSGCFISTDFNDTSFLCTDQPVCPSGYSCVEGRCVLPSEGSPDAGGGGGGGGGGGDDGGGTVTAPFSYREQLTFDNQGRGQLDGVPVMVALTPDRFDYGAVRSDGGDVQFADADGTALPHEIESWNPGGTSILWVRVPRIDAGSASDFVWMYYGNPDTVVPQDAAGVWSRYRAVYHLDAVAGDATGTSVPDSTSQGFDGTASGADAIDGGAVGQARRFDGVVNYVDLGQDRDFLRATAAFTVEEWVRPGIMATSGVVFGSSINGGVDSRSQLLVRPELTVEGGARTQDGGTLLKATGGTVTSQAWTWVAFEADFPGDTLSLYYDADLAAQQSGLGLGPTTPDTSDSQTVLGVDEDLNSNHFLGDLDEVRVSTTAESPDWLSAQYASMTDQLVSFGQPESL